MTFFIVSSLRVAMPVLVIMALSGDSWRSFGIVRPRWIVDALGACAIWFIASGARYFILSLLPPSMLHGLASAHTLHQARHEGIAGFFLLVVAEGANGFAEELVMRAYLITRLQRLLSSTWLAVVVTTALFASYHAYLGPVGVFSAAAGGLVYAISFCWFRRLWPLCVAHAVHDILIRF
jgi:membrane protease YdiL (CAAX protease family)